MSSAADNTTTISTNNKNNNNTTINNNNNKNNMTIADSTKKNKNKGKGNSKKSKNQNNNNNNSDLLQEEIKIEKYKKLIYLAQKDLHKQIKQIKVFEIQKLIRKLKQQQQQNNNEKKESLLQELKSTPLEPIVQEGIRQLGLLHLNPIQQQQQEQQQSMATATTTDNTDSNTISKQVMDKFLKHKKFISCMEMWHEKVTDYRRWCLKLQERQEQKQIGIPITISSSHVSNNNKKGKKQQKKNKSHSEQKAGQSNGLATEPSSSLFCNLGGGDNSGDLAMTTKNHDNNYTDDNKYNDNDDDNNDDEFNSYSQYGPGAMDFVAPKKNRKGQRARKAKAMAIQAKKEGRMNYQSINWREPKPKSKQQQEEQQAEHDDSKQDIKGNTNQTGNVKPKITTAAEHPSWAAKQSQKVGIVAFQGKKITFN